MHPFNLWIAARRIAIPLLAALAISGIPEEARADAAKPNILVIFGDDIGQGNISRYTIGLVGY